VAGGQGEEFDAKEAARRLRISLPTLWRIEKEGRLVPRRNHKGRRWYTLGMLQRYLNGSRRKR
jgi:DNA-binding transcriptional MerR regulator